MIIPAEPAEGETGEQRRQRHRIAIGLHMTVEFHVGAPAVALAAAAIDDGRAAQALERLARITSTPLETDEDA